MIPLGLEVQTLVWQVRKYYFLRGKFTVLFIEAVSDADLHRHRSSIFAIPYYHEAFQNCSDS